MSDKPKLALDVPDPPPITPEDIERIKEEGKDWAAVIKRAGDAMKPGRRPLVGDPKTELKKCGTCVVCQGDVVQRITYQYRGGNSGPVRRVGYDPKKELRSPYNTNTIYGGYHCAKCGLRYEFPPPSDDTSTVE